MNVTSDIKTRFLAYRQARIDAVSQANSTSGITAIVTVPKIDSFAAVDIREAIERGMKIHELCAPGNHMQFIDYPFDPMLCLSSFDPSFTGVAHAKTMEVA